MSTKATETTTEDLIDASADAAANTGENRRKFLTFRLGDEEYGLGILNVREIIGVIDITPLPQTPDYVKGVINLRGKIIPVMELRTRFGLSAVAYGEETCIIVVEVEDEAEGGAFQMGVVVDTVSEVLDIAEDRIEPAPKFGCRLDTDFIMGMGKSKDRVITLLEVDAVLSRADLAGLLGDIGGEDEFADDVAEAA
jgi:purine-binding chemotaxis protein CheW